jgi:hypothetical protein
MAPRKTAAKPHCELCGRAKPLTFHHLIPRAVHSKKRFQRRFAKDEMHGRGLWICRLCHSGIHDLISEKELADSYHTREALIAHDGVAKHITWVRRQK